MQASLPAFWQVAHRFLANLSNENADSLRSLLSSDKPDSEIGKELSSSTLTKEVSDAYLQLTPEDRKKLKGVLKKVAEQRALGVYDSSW